MVGEGAVEIFTLPSMGAGGVIVAVLFMIFTGRLVPRYLYRMIVEDRDQWRKIALTLTKQNNELLVGARVSSKALDSIPVGGDEDNAKPTT